AVTSEGAVQDSEVARVENTAALPTRKVVGDGAMADGERVGVANAATQAANLVGDRDACDRDRTAGDCTAGDCQHRGLRKTRAATAVENGAVLARAAKP